MAEYLGKSVLFIIGIIGMVFLGMPASGYARESSITKVNSDFFIQLDTNTQLSIGKNTMLVINANIELYDNIRGKGKLLLTSSNNSIDFFSNAHSVENIDIQTQSMVNVYKPLFVRGALRILCGNLFLYDEDLILSESAYSKFTDWEQVKFSGKGKIVCTNPFPMKVNFTFIQTINISKDIAKKESSKKEFNPKLVLFHTDYYNKKVLKLFLEKKTPPPKTLICQAI